MCIVGEDVEVDVGVVHGRKHQFSLPGDGGLGHGVGRCVLPTMNMFVDSVGSETFYRKSFSLDPGIVSKHIHRR